MRFVHLVGIFEEMDSLDMPRCVSEPPISPELLRGLYPHAIFGKDPNKNSGVPWLLVAAHRSIQQSSSSRRSYRTSRSRNSLFVQQALVLIGVCAHWKGRACQLYKSESRESGNSHVLVAHSTSVITQPKYHSFRALTYPNLPSLFTSTFEFLLTFLYCSTW
jgi:hypothetical protein